MFICILNCEVKGEPGLVQISSAVLLQKEPGTPCGGGGLSIILQDESHAAHPSQY